MNELEGIILGEIRREGTISFARFMEMALYFPALGYYETPGRIGKEGDFYTSVSVGDFFGGLLAWSCLEVAERLETKSFHILEAGANDGRLSGDILDWLQKFRPELAARTHYRILEPSILQRETQRETLSRFGNRVQWFSDWPEIAPFAGIIFSNELFDAMPAHVLKWDANQKVWREWGVGEQNGVWVWKPLERRSGTPAGAPQIPEDLKPVLPEGFTVEICPAAARWWREAARRLKTGRLLAIDYGAAESELLTPRFAAGTLRGYSRHHGGGDVLSRPGEQDITAHVNFTALEKAGAGEGLQTVDFTRQESFLSKLFERVWKAHPNLIQGKELRQLRTLTHPEHLGRSFRVLAQERMRPGSPTI